MCILNSLCMTLLMCEWEKIYNKLNIFKLNIEERNV